MATDVLMKRIKEEEKLLKLQQEGVMLEAQLDSFRARGTTKLTAVETAKIMVEAEKERRATVKNSVGNILEYEITLNTNITINDFLTDTTILKQNFNYSIGYKVQDEHFETIKLEYDYLSSAEKLLEFQRLYFDDELIKKKIQLLLFLLSFG